MSDYLSYYDERRRETYAQAYTKVKATDHSEYESLKGFIEKFNLADKRCLEIGSSGGFFQDMVDDYWGVDVAECLAEHYHKPYRVAKDGIYPFESASFDAIWTIHVFEHIPDLQKALLEIERLLKPGGVVYFSPAWQCRSWAADGYAVRPYGDFNLFGKLVKASIPLRNSVVWRSLFIFPKRIVRHLLFLLGRRYEQIKFKKLKANYETYWHSDSDACNSIDPHDAILWFRSHGFECISHPSELDSFLVRTGTILLRKTVRLE